MGGGDLGVGADGGGGLGGGIPKGVGLAREGWINEGGVILAGLLGM